MSPLMPRVIVLALQIKGYKPKERDEILRVYAMFGVPLRTIPMRDSLKGKDLVRSAKAVLESERMSWEYERGALRAKFG